MLSHARRRGYCRCVRLVTWNVAGRVGRQPEQIGGRTAWVLPNPSGLNAHYQLPDLIRLFSELREWVGAAA